MSSSKNEFNYYDNTYTARYVGRLDNGCIIACAHKIFEIVLHYTMVLQEYYVSTLFCMFYHCVVAIVCSISYFNCPKYMILFLPVN